MATGLRFGTSRPKGRWFAQFASGWAVALVDPTTHGAGPPTAPVPTRHRMRITRSPGSGVPPMPTGRQATYRHAMRDTFIPARLDVAICHTRPFDRAALEALCRLEPRLTITHTTGDPRELVKALAVPRGRTIVLLGIRALRDGGGASLVDELHAVAPRPRVILVGVDIDTLPLSVAEAHADGYLRPDGDTAEQLAVIIPPETSRA
jgi:hypothetical protein